VHTVKAVILPHQTEETKEIKKRLRLFEDKVSEFRVNFTKVCPFDFGELNEEIINNSYRIVDE